MLVLNRDVVKNISKVEKVFLFDIDACNLLLWKMMKHPTATGNFPREVGLHSISDDLCIQVALYEMPDETFCAVCYPSSVKVDYNEFKKGIEKLFKSVNDIVSDDAYTFYLYCLHHGYESQLKN